MYIKKKDSILFKRKLENLKKQNAHFKGLLLDTIKIETVPKKNKLNQQDANCFEQGMLLLGHKNEKELLKDVKYFTPKSSSQTDFHKNVEDRIEKIIAENKRLREKLEAVLKGTQQECEEVIQIQNEQIPLFTIFQKNDEIKTKELKHLFNVTDEKSLNKKLFKEYLKIYQKTCQLSEIKYKLLRELQDLTQNHEMYGKYQMVTDKGEDLNKNVVQLENEKANLINQLQHVLNQSRNQISKEHCCMLKIMTKLELERFNVKYNLNIPLKQNTENEENFISELNTNNTSKSYSTDCNCINDIKFAYYLQHYKCNKELSGFL